MLTPSNKLGAINSMLSAVGEAPITNLETDLAEAEIALSILDDVSREVQSKGWSWNTQRDRAMPKTSTGEVLLPVNTLKVDIKDKDTKRPDRTRRVTRRGDKLYDLLERSFTFEIDVYLDLVLGLAFEDLTESARRYILLDATSRYMQNVLGADVELQQMQLQAQKAWVQMEQEEDEMGDLNVIADNPLTNYSAIRTRNLN